MVFLVNTCVQEAPRPCTIERAVEELIAGPADGVVGEACSRARAWSSSRTGPARTRAFDVVRLVVVLDAVDVAAAVSVVARSFCAMPGGDLAAVVGHLLGGVADHVDRRRGHRVGHVAGRAACRPPGVARQRHQRRHHGGVVAVGVDLRLGDEGIVGAARRSRQHERSDVVQLSCSRTRRPPSRSRPPRPRAPPACGGPARPRSGSGWKVMVGLARSSRSYGLTRTQPAQRASIAQHAHVSSRVAAPWCRRMSWQAWASGCRLRRALHPRHERAAIPDRRPACGAG